jgi:hypothetical protein
MDGVQLTAVSMVATSFSQWGLITSTASGHCGVVANSASAAPAAPGCRANIGGPWATNNTEAEVITLLLEPEGSLRGMAPQLQWASAAAARAPWAGKVITNGRSA